MSVIPGDFDKLPKYGAGLDTAYYFRKAILTKGLCMPRFPLNWLLPNRY